MRTKQEPEPGVSLIGPIRRDRKEDARSARAFASQVQLSAELLRTLEQAPAMTPARSFRGGCPTD